jgi:prepilin-type N-terminal cleavage/methylation domain-containing protein
MSRRGVTLIELLVVLTILGAMAGLSALSLAGSAKRCAEPSCRLHRREAIHSGVALLDTSTAHGGGCPSGPLRFFPDGRVVGRDPLAQEERADAHR